MHTRGPGPFHRLEDFEDRRRLFSVANLGRCKGLRRLVLTDVVCGLERLIQLKDLSLLINHNRSKMGMDERIIGERGGNLIAKGLKCLRSLERLVLVIDNEMQLHSSRIGSRAGLKLFNALASCQMLTSLKIGICENGISDDAGAILGRSIGHLIHVQNLELDLRNNNFAMRSCSALSEALQFLVQLKLLTVDFGQNFISDECVSVLSSGVQSLRNLVHLSLSFDETAVGSTCAASLGQCLEHLHKMKHLQLSFPIESRIEEVHAISFSNGLACLSRLESLILRCWACDVGNDGVSALARGISELACLASVDIELYDSKIDAEGLTALAQSLRNLEHLAKLRLDLGRNELGPRGGIVLADLIQSKSACLVQVDLDLSGCRIGWSSAENLLQALCSLPKLEHVCLNLNDNMLSRSVWKACADFQTELASRCKDVQIGCINEHICRPFGNDDEDSWDEEEYTNLGLAFLGCF